LQEADTTRSELTCSSRLVSTPVAATRLPTLFLSASGSGGAIRATGAVRFFRKPVRQLRDFGASVPSVSARRKSFPSVLISRHPVIVTGDGLAPGAGDGVAGLGSGTTGAAVDSLAGATCAFAESDAGGAGRVDAAVRFVAFTTDGFLALSVSARVLTTGFAVVGGRRAGASVLGGEYGTSAARARCPGACCAERAMSLVGHRGTAIVAITSTAIPASIPICRPVVCHGGVACITGAATVVGVASTAGCEAGTGAATGAAVVAGGGMTGSA
jgi:hypothetical protein